MPDALLDIVHEDAEILVLDKPAGLVCHPTKAGALSSLIGRVRLHLGEAVQPHMVNRLDRETSGLVLVAKTPRAARELHRVWEKRRVEKEYLAVVHGHVAAGAGSIDAPLGRDEASQVAIKDCVRSDGAPAWTAFEVLRRFSHRSPDGVDLALTLLRVLPRTGRKHQIRIHLAHLGHPVVGDKIYGGHEEDFLALVEGRLGAARRAQLLVPHHALHAGTLRFLWRNEPREFRCEPHGWEAWLAGTANHPA